MVSAVGAGPDAMRSVRTPSRLPDGTVDVPEAARRLTAGLLTEPWGQMSPSVYETGRLVRIAPWLDGHHARIRFLIDSQRPDGGWGPSAGPEHPVGTGATPSAYHLVPTLSATEALLSLLVEPVAADAVAGSGRVAGEPVPRAAVVAAAQAGLAALARTVNSRDAESAPDTPAIELIVPALVAAVNERLGALAGDPALASMVATVPALNLPVGMDAGLLTRVRAYSATGADLPLKLLHSLEVLGQAAVGAQVPISAVGMIGASPAATAAWLGGRRTPAPTGRVAAALTGLAREYGGPVPSVVPITVFERAWVLGTFAAADLTVETPAELVRAMADTVGDGVTPGGAGLPPDADTTSMVLYTLARLGRPVSVDGLREFEADTHFRTWQDERTPSTTTNAHVLDALGVAAAYRPGGRAGVAAAVDKVVGWLAAQQLPDGSWLDKWHASPYYATACCALALGRYGGPAGAAPLRRAVRFLLDSQRPDGSWGMWSGTAEETGYAVQVLLGTADGPAMAGEATAAAVGQAATRGYAYLSATMDDGYAHPPLWHDKDLYLPRAVVSSATLAALHMAQSRPDLVIHAHRSMVGPAVRPA